MIRDPQMRVYFVKPVGQDGPIKIGHSVCVEKRLRELGKWSPVPLELIATISPTVQHTQWGPFFDGLDLERRFHQRYADHRLHFEWFTVHPQLASDLEAIKAGTFNHDALPPVRKRDKVAA
jgi:hypothetical protein